MPEDFTQNSSRPPRRQGQEPATRHPTEDERERLVFLMEEASEVIQMSAKVLRFGWCDVYPDRATGTIPDFHDEIGDMMGVLELMRARGDVEWSRVERQIPRKLAKIARFHPHQIREVGQ